MILMTYNNDTLKIMRLVMNEQERLQAQAQYRQQALDAYREVLQDFQDMKTDLSRVGGIHASVAQEIETTLKEGPFKVLRDFNDGSGSYVTTEHARGKTSDALMTARRALRSIQFWTEQAVSNRSMIKYCGDEGVASGVGYLLHFIRDKRFNHGMEFDWFVVDDNQRGPLETLVKQWAGDQFMRSYLIKYLPSSDEGPDEVSLSEEQQAQINKQLHRTLQDMMGLYTTRIAAIEERLKSPLEKTLQGLLGQKVENLAELLALGDDSSPEDQRLKAQNYTAPH
jgi:hypothetical protein